MNLNMKLHRLCLVLAAAAPGLQFVPNGLAQSLTPGSAVSIGPGSNSCVTASIPAALPNNYTISAWIYLNSGSPGYDPGLAVLSSSTCGGSIEFLLRGSGPSSPQTLQLSRCDSFDGPSSTTTVPLSTWVNVAVSVSPAKLVSYFINGIPSGTWTASGDVTLSTSFLLGANTFYRRFDGLLDEFQIWKTALTASQIQANLYHSLVGNESGLVLYYRFDEGAGPTVSNSVSSGSADIGTLTDGASWVVSTVPFLPQAATSSAILITTNSATLQGSVIPNNLPAGASFEWGTTTSPYPYTNFVAQALGSGTAYVPVSLALSGLAPGTRYHFRTAATNGVGRGVGSDATFSTLALRAVTTLADSGPGSLRTAISSSASGDFVYFAVNGIITNLSELPVTNTLTILGPGGTNVILNGGAANRIFNLNTNANLSLSGLTLSGGHAPNGADESQNVFQNGGDAASGGAIYNAGTLVLNGCILATNRAGNGGTAGEDGAGGAGGNGGAIFNSGTLTLSNCTLQANQAGTGGGYNTFGGGGASGNGGAIFNSGTLVVEACTLNANTSGAGASSRNDAGANGGSGGAIFSSGSLWVANSTLAANSAGAAGGSVFFGANGGNGGGICSSGNSTLVACTLSGNAVGAGYGNFFATGTDGSGGGLFASDGTFMLRDTLVAGNLIGGIGNGSGPDLSGGFQSQGYNLIGSADSTMTLSYQPTDRIGSRTSPVNAYLAPLANNGGPTATMAPLGGSPAIDAGDDAILNTPYNLSTDQRGQPRRQGAHVDIGAYEFNAALSPAPIVATLAPGTATNNLLTGTAQALLNASVNPNGLPTTLYFQYGPALAYGGSTASIGVGFGTASVTTNLLVSGLLGGPTYHLRAVATSASGTSYGGDQVLTTTPFLLAGDEDGDGVVSGSEANAVLLNYFSGASATIMTNPATLGGGYFQFGITNLLGWGLEVQASSDLSSWSNVPAAAFPVYQFLDPDATNAAHRYYRLR